MRLPLSFFLATSLFAADWPEWRGAGRRGVLNETGILDPFPATGIRVKWRTPIQAGYSGPSVADGRVFDTDFRTVHPADGPPSGPEMNLRRASGLEGKERIVALDEKTGKTLWASEWDADYTGIMQSYAIGPRATPTVDGNRVYVQGAMGHLRCLDAASGALLWRKDYVKEFGLKIRVWGMAAPPLVDGPRVIVIAGGADNADVVALDKMNGKVLWKAISVEVAAPGYAPPFLLEAGGAPQLIIWHPTAVSSLDPATGQLLWELPWNVKTSGLIVGTPVRQGNRLFLSCFYNGPFMIHLDPAAPKATLAWKGRTDSEIDTDGLHSIISTPVLDGDYIYGVCSYGQFRCLDARTGKRVWETQAVTVEKAPWASPFLGRPEDRYFITNNRGERILP